MTAASPSIVPHSAVDDVVSLASGTLLVSLGLVILSAGPVVTGGTAGLALLLSYATPVPFGVLFAILNLPFLAIAARGAGWSFMLRSVLVICALAALATLLPRILAVDVDAITAALLGNVLCGVGLVILFRHKASPGGFSVVAVIAQERWGIRAGLLLMAVDAVIVLSSLTVASPLTVLVSAGGVVVLNTLIALNHRPGRYYGG